MEIPTRLHRFFTYAPAAGAHDGRVSVLAGYVHGYNRRAPALSVLIVEPRAAKLDETVARYLVRCSFAMAAVPQRAASAVQMFAFDAIVVPPGIDAGELGKFARVFDQDDPIAVARALRSTAVARRPRLLNA
jgi:hypothetical protein